MTECKYDLQTIENKLNDFTEVTYKHHITMKLRFDIDIKTLQ